MDLWLCVQTLKASQTLLKDNDLEESDSEIREDSMMDDRSEYEHNKYAKRHANSPS